MDAYPLLKGMGNMGNMSMMGQYFFFSEDMNNFLFDGLNLHHTAGIAGACLVMLGLTFVLEGTRSLTVYLQLRLKQNPLTYGRTDISINQDRSPLFSTLMIPTSIEQIRRQRIRYHVSSYLLHTVNLLFSYIIMLAVMTYNVYILLAVIVGSGLGYFIFGAVTARNQANFARVHEDIYNSRVTLNDSQITEVG